MLQKSNFVFFTIKQLAKIRFFYEKCKRSTEIVERNMTSGVFTTFPDNSKKSGNFAKN